MCRGRSWRADAAMARARYRVPHQEGADFVNDSSATDKAAAAEELARLRERAQFFRSIADNIPLPVLISSVADGSIFYANHAYGQLIGSANESLVGLRTPDFYEEEECARLKDDLIHAQAAAQAGLSTPLIPISDKTVVMPLVGTIDSRGIAFVLGQGRSVPIRNEAPSG